MPEANYTQHWFYPQIWVPVWEEWLAVVGYEGLYEVSNWGRVRSLERILERCRNGVPYTCRWSGKIMTDSSKGRYPRVPLYKNWEKRRESIHRLVLEAFIGPCPEGMVACHFPDRDTRNNNVLNLRWGTSKDNGQDKILHGTSTKGIPCNVGETSGNSKLTESQVKDIRSRPRFYGSVPKLAKEFSVTVYAIRNVLSGQNWRHLL